MSLRQQECTHKFNEFEPTFVALIASLSDGDDAPPDFSMYIKKQRRVCINCGLEQTRSKYRPLTDWEEYQ